MQPCFQCSPQKRQRTYMPLFFIDNVLGLCFALQSQVLNPRHFPAGNVALTTSYNQTLRSLVYFSDVLQTQTQKGNFFKNPAAEQRSFPQGCTVRP